MSAGKLRVNVFDLVAAIAKLIQFHHVPWQNGQGSLYQGEPVPLGSHLLHLADRTAVKISKDKPILSQVRRICDAISSLKGEAFVGAHCIKNDSMARGILSVIKRTTCPLVQEL
jgi:hypothetical protein